MVLKQNQNPCNNEFYQLSYMESRQTDSRSKLTSGVNIHPSGIAPEKPCGASGEGKGKRADVCNHTHENGFRVGDAVELTKRPLRFDDVCERTAKRPRKVDHCTTHTYLCHDEIIMKPHSSDVGSDSFDQCEGHPLDSAATSQQLPDTDNYKVFGNSEDVVENASFGISHASPDRDICGNDEGPDVCLLPLCPRFIEEDLPPNDLVLLDGFYGSVLDILPRKQVALGPDHQADIPAWNPENLEGACVQNDVKVGTCIVPMPDSDTQVNLGVRTETNLTCGCLDRGSIRCIRHHVAEAREDILKAVGAEKFAELGFCDMGEDVALKWTEDEENVFHQVVFSNPASLGKNFWNILPLVFPNKSSKELVSYYFNVFVLRKRAQQNRSEPLYIDSDDDEWHATDNVGFALEDYEEDSVVNSPAHQEGIYGNDSHDERPHEGNIYAAEDVSDDYGSNPHDINEHVGDDLSISSCKSTPIPDENCPESGNNRQALEHDLQDDSCTSYEGQNSEDCRGEHDNPVMAQCAVETVFKKLAVEHKSDDPRQHNNLMCSSSHCGDSKAWEIGCFPLSKKGGVDFLPTCHVIEEVFGKDNGTRDGQGTI